ncbi:MAG: hypothetical protein LBT43_16685 [Prevotella sp.]|nr:hypothetical protein [Prevotella sp.]
MGQNNTELSIDGLSAEYSSYRTFPYTSALRIGCTRPLPRCGDRTEASHALAEERSASFLLPFGQCQKEGQAREGAAVMS